MNSIAIGETNTAIQNFLSGGGKMGKLIRSMDWSKTSLGNPKTWPQSLRTSVSICLNSRFPILIWWGKDLVKIYNDAYCDLIAAKHPKAIGAKGLDVWPEIWPIIGPMLEDVLQKGKSTWSEDQLLIVERNGYPEECYFTFSYSPIKDETNGIGGVFSVVTETTKKVLTERHLTRQLNNLFVQAPVALCILRGKNYVVEVVNEKMLEFWGRKVEEVLNKPVFDGLPEVRGQGFKELLDNVYKTGEGFVAQELPVNLHRNGKMETAFVKFAYEPLREEDGTISGIMALADEITDQVLARKKVEEAEEKARIAIESAELSVYEINLLSNELSGDSRFYHLFGFDNIVCWQELIPLIHPEDLFAMEMAHKESLVTGRLYYETRIASPDKSFHWLKIYGKIFYNEQNTPLKLLGVVEDVTKQKQLERQKDDFFAIASHELKTPVTTIKAYAQIAESMLEKKGDEETLGMIKRMSTQVNKLTALIGNLLDFTKIQKGKLKYNEVFFDFNELVKEAIDEMQKTSGTHDIKNNSGESANIFGDKDKLSQVLNNLISNAIKYSPKADRIIVSTELQKEGIELSVQDIGIGISSEKQKNVFEQFYRVYGDSQSTFPGMGIGLYICSEIITRQGGKIWVESIIDKGSTFYIWLPFDHRNKITSVL
jgi:two-component system sensor histidine kinase VicK